MAFDIQFKLIYQGIRDVFRVRSLRFLFCYNQAGKGKRALAKGRKAHHPGKDSSAIFVGNNKERRK
jgi:hypothetical protein